MCIHMFLDRSPIIPVKWTLDVDGKAHPEENVKKTILMNPDIAFPDSGNVTSIKMHIKYPDSIIILQLRYLNQKSYKIINTITVSKSTVGVYTVGVHWGVQKGDTIAIKFPGKAAMGFADRGNCDRLTMVETESTNDTIKFTNLEKRPCREYPLVAYMTSDREYGRYRQLPIYIPVYLVMI